MLKAIVVVGAMVLALVSSSALAQNVVRKYQTVMEVNVDARGQIAHVGTPDNLPSVLVNDVRKAASDWRFKPIQVAGHSVPATAWVYATVEVVKRKDGHYGVLVVYRRNGPKVLNNDPPKYPERATADHAQAELLFAVKVDPDGSLHVLRLIKNHGDDISMFVKVSRKAIETWHADPMRVDGKAIASQVQIPIRFRLSEFDAFGRPLKRGGGEAAPAWARMPPGQLYASDSPLQFLPAKAQATTRGKNSTSG